MSEDSRSPDKIYTFPTDDMIEAEKKRKPPKNGAAGRKPAAHGKGLENSLSSVGAKIADANELADEIKTLSKLQSRKLSSAQKEVADIYEALDD